MNQEALREEIREVRRKSNGTVGVNIMRALSDYQTLVKAAVEEKVDVIISGAGLPLDLPSYLEPNSKTKLIPIVSSARAANIIIKKWTKNYNHLPDAIIVEGPKSGGHQGYSFEELRDSDFVSYGLEKRLSEVIQLIKSNDTTKNIPVIAAGGIFYGGDIKKFNSLGAAGAQMATRFVTTDECDADIKFKQTYLDCKSEKDIVLIHSPVGMPGRAIYNNFLIEVEQGKKFPIKCEYNCLHTCSPKESPYCIANALKQARIGNLEKGFAFAGVNAWRCDEIIPVEKLVLNLDKEYNDNIKIN